LTTLYPTRISKRLNNQRPAVNLPAQHCVSHFYDVGKMGIEHALLPEQGIVTAGDCIIGADSHTCTYGALGAFSTGVGSTDMAAGMATGIAWFKVPSAVPFNFTGKLPPNCSGKDVILTIIGHDRR
jgi:3-isopropylmalate/(R)-2-methylmalate dehydratase large subunit